MVVATHWVITAANPTPMGSGGLARPQLPVGAAISGDAEQVLYAAQKGHMTTKKAFEYLDMTRARVIAAHRELINKGLLVGIGQGGARRYLINVKIGELLA